MAQYPNHVPLDATPEEIKEMRVYGALSELAERMGRYAKDRPVEDYTLRKIHEAGEAMSLGIEAQLTALVCLTICARRETESIPDWPEYRNAMHTLDIYPD